MQVHEAIIVDARAFSLAPDLPAVSSPGADGPQKAWRTIKASRWNELVSEVHRRSVSSVINAW